jgi:hypothetical protein
MNEWMNDDIIKECVHSSTSNERINVMWFKSHPNALNSQETIAFDNEWEQMTAITQEKCCETTENEIN